MVEKGAIKQTLLDLIIVQQLPFLCVKWLEFYTFIRALADNPNIILIYHLTNIE